MRLFEKVDKQLYDAYKNSPEARQEPVLRGYARLFFSVYRNQSTRTLKVFVPQFTRYTPFSTLKRSSAPAAEATTRPLMS